MSIEERVIFERETANDEVGTVVEIHCASGTVTKPGQHLFDIENSKAVQEVYCRTGGILKHDLHIGLSVNVGSVLATLLSAETGTQEGTYLPAEDTRQESKRSKYVSVAAADLIEKHNLKIDLFSDTFTTSKKVESHLNLKSLSMEGGPISSLGVSKLKPYKAREIHILSRGAGASMLSSVGIEVGGGPYFRQEAGFFETRISDLVIFLGSRLMKTHPGLNACFSNDEIKLYSDVTAGLAFAGGEKLVTYGIKRSDKKTLKEIQSDVISGFRRYVVDKLSPADVSGVTFTVTDLSSMNIDFIFPLLPEGQSCIIGIARGSCTGRFRLYLSFDHRVTEGLVAASFLAKLSKDISNSLAQSAGT